jgi:hypothetical protein
MPDSKTLPAPEPLYARRARSAQMKNDEFFRNARTAQGRQSPKSWNAAPPNTTNAKPHLEPRLAGTTAKPRTRERLVNGKRVMVGIDRTTGVTASDRAATQTTNNQFFNEIREQQKIERARAKK